MNPFFSHEFTPSPHTVNNADKEDEDWEVVEVVVLSSVLDAMVQL